LEKAAKDEMEVLKSKDETVFGTVEDSF